MTKTQNSSANRINALTEKLLRRNKAYQAKTQTKVRTTNKSGEAIQEDVLTKNEETGVSTLINAQITIPIKITSERYTVTIFEEIIEKEILIGETFIEGIIVKITRTMTTEMKYFSKKIIKKLEPY